MTRTTGSAKSDKLARLLAQARQDAELTQAQVAKRLRRPQSFVSKYESAERRLDVVEFLEVAKAIGADPHEIIRRLQGR